MGKEQNNEFWQNDRFIRDMLSQDKEAIEYWESYLREHPEKRDAFEQSRHEFKRVKLNSHSLSKEKTDSLLNKIHEDYARKRKRRKLHFYLCCVSVAACLSGLLYLIPSMYMNTFSTSEKTQASVVSLDSIRTEVTLITENSETIAVADNSVIACDSNVYVRTGQGPKTLLTKLEEKTGKIAYNTLIVPPGKRSSLILADGSKVWVNAGTTLRFPSSFASEKRLIEVEGEIYIEVAKEKFRPFYVKTPDFTVNVLGTCFNVSAYSDEEIQSVVLVKGKVAVKTKNVEEIKLEPNQMLTMMQQKTEISKVDVYDYISWKDGIMQFEGESVGEVLKRLSRYYDVQIECESSVASRSCGGELLLFDDINQVMETFSILFDVKYQLVSDTIRIE